MDNTWVIQVETDVFTIIKTRVTNRIEDKYPDLNFTMLDEENTETKFPTVYMHFLPSVEVGQDLDGTSINGIIATVEYRVVVSAKQGLNAAREIAGQIMAAFKELRFENNAMAEFDNKNQDTVRMVGRARRTIGQSDSF